MSATVLERTEVTQRTSTASGKLRAHIVSPTAALREALINQTAVTALCGYSFTPRRNPKPFPICTRCLEIHHEMTGNDWAA